MLHKLIILIVQVIEIYSLLLIVWVIGSWFASFRANKIYRWIDSIVYPYASLFRKLIPPVGGFDFSVILAFFVLVIAQKIILGLLLPVVL